MAKDLNTLKWIENLLPTGYRRKSMFGGFGYYIDEKMILAAFEGGEDRSYRGQKFDFALWNGCMFPAEKENHDEILKLFPFLINHPVLPKWLYIPVESENFDDHIETIMKEIRRQSPLFGTIPQRQSKKKISKKDPLLFSKTLLKMDTRRPRMFSDEPIEQVLTQAKKISDLKNLGPSSEVTFAKAGIKTAQQFIKMGWKKAMILLVKSNPKNRHSLFAYAIIGALKNLEWNGISEEDKKEAREFTASLKTLSAKKEKSPLQKASKPKKKKKGGRTQK